MTEDVTATVDGIDFDADDLESALDQAVDENGIIYGDYGVVGEVVVSGDNYEDADCMVAKLSAVNSVNDEGQIDISDGSETAFTRVEFIRSAIEDARENQFDPAEYVRELVSNVNTITVGEYDGKVEISHGQHMAGDEMNALADDDAVTFDRVECEGGRTVVNVFVDEDEVEEEEDDEEGLGDLFG